VQKGDVTQPENLGSIRKDVCRIPCFRYAKNGRKEAQEAADKKSDLACMSSLLFPKSTLPLLVDCHSLPPGVTLGATALHTEENRMVARPVPTLNNPIKGGMR
jgi:hypothetical protein